MQARRFLNNFFSCHSKIDILRTIIESEEPQSGRQIAAKAGLSPRSCQLSLDELVKLRALHRREAGKAYYYSVNLENQLVTDLIIPIIQQEERLTEYVVDQLRVNLSRGKTGAVGHYFLESWPRAWGGKGNGGILLAIIPDDKYLEEVQERLKDQVDYLLDNFGLPADMVIITHDDFSEIVKNRPGDLDKIRFRLQNLVGERFQDLVRREKGFPEHLQRAVDFFPRKRSRYNR